MIGTTGSARRFSQTCDDAGPSGASTPRRIALSAGPFSERCRPCVPAKGLSSATAPGKPHRSGDRRTCRLSSGSQPSWLLTGRQLENLTAATSYAVEIGHPLNRFITINWSLGSVADCVGATGRFLKYAGDWLRKRGVPPTYIWVREHGRIAGRHVHILMHVTPTLTRRFSELQFGWLKGAGVPRQRKGTIKTKPVGRAYRTALSGPAEVYRVELGKTLAYLLKQSQGNPRAACGFGRPGSPVVGKRCSTSQNIGRAARGEANRLTAHRNSAC